MTSSARATRARAAAAPPPVSDAARPCMGLTEGTGEKRRKKSSQRRTCLSTGEGCEGRIEGWVPPTPKRAGRYSGERNSPGEESTKSQTLSVRRGSMAARRSRSQLNRKDPKRPEVEWWARKRGRRGPHSKAAGNCEQSWKAQSRNCRNTGETSLSSEALAEPCASRHWNLWPKDSHSFSTSDAKPRMVRAKGSRITCARPHTCAVRSQPSEQWTRTGAARLWRAWATRMAPLSTVRTCESHSVASTERPHCRSGRRLSASASTLPTLSRMRWMFSMSRNQSAHCSYVAPS
mmetsp:Transcript_18850/g.71838  ORF Transcript_18850/g.71838 Transcript_18850/m.71838 type:complete len:291 (-) Transcript_18850:396-1268(-)